MLSFGTLRKSRDSSRRPACRTVAESFRKERAGYEIQQRFQRTAGHHPAHGISEPRIRGTGERCVAKRNHPTLLIFCKMPEQFAQQCSVSIAAVVTVVTNLRASPQSADSCSAGSDTA